MEKTTGCRVGGGLLHNPEEWEQAGRQGSGRGLVLGTLTGIQELCSSQTIGTAKQVTNELRLGTREYK